MIKVKYLILGAGPSGLTFAHSLLKKGEKDFIVIEKEKEAGGLCRSSDVDGSPLDIGGGHFLDTRNSRVNEFLFDFMDITYWNTFIRNSKIKIGDIFIDHPFEANLWQFDTEKQIEYLKSISTCGSNLNEPMPDKFVDWIYWKLGDKIANDYMLPYNQKMFANDLNELGVYWLDKLPSVSFEETLRSCLAKKAYGKQPGHSKFYYPKQYGSGELWLRMANRLGKRIKYCENVTAIDTKDKSVTLSSNTEIRADYIISTIPWKSVGVYKNTPEHIINNISKLRHSSVEIRYFNESLQSEAHWIYYPDKDLPYHRILLRSNFCQGSKGYWTETRQERTDMFNSPPIFNYVNEYAYPINTIDKLVLIKEILEFMKSCNIYGLGRWGEHSHYNSDVTVERALNLCEEISK